MQLIAGLLLMTQRFAKLGAIMFVAIVSNIFVITISNLGFSGTPIVTGLMLLATLMLVMWDWNEIKILFSLPPDFNIKERLEQFKIWEIIGLALFTVTVGVKLFKINYDFLVWGVCFLLIAVIGLILGLRKFKRMNLNNIN